MDSARTCSPLEMTMKLGKLDKSRHSTHSKSNNYADDNLLHDIPFIVPTRREPPTADFAPRQILAFHKGILIYRLLYSGSAYLI